MASSAEITLLKYIRDATEPFAFEPNLALNLEIADLINQKKGNLPRVAAFAIVRKINDRNPTVAYLAVNLLDICVKNCGYAFHLQIATKDFLNELVRRFPEHPRMGINKIQQLILRLIEEWRLTICKDSRYKDDFGFIRDMHILLGYNGYKFPEISKDDITVLSEKNTLKSIEELEREDREAMSAKLQELIRRGTPTDLAEANKLMKIMAGYDTQRKKEYRDRVIASLEKLKRKATLFGEMLAGITETDQLSAGDVYDELATSLQEASIKLERILKDDFEDENDKQQVASLYEYVTNLTNQYKCIKNRDVEGAANFRKTANEVEMVSAKSNSDLLIDLNFQPDTNSEINHTTDLVGSPASQTATPPIHLSSLAPSASSQPSALSPEPTLSNILHKFAYFTLRYASKEFQQNKLSLVLKLSNDSTKLIDNFQLFIAVPKVYKLQLEPQSGSMLPAGAVEGITQQVSVYGPLNPSKGLPVRLKVTYKIDGVLKEEFEQSVIPL
ncbi:adaptin [Schizosaccharomyces japonicus yFS275]|uniref:Adaptin n=1 Tax=Schizosaccharomyces japonicus (strain yFS275 / FY16936) TaxID=402676 RepID=B6K1I2_SCHJY|nr:adaptin [Schizosaccharomyces japonicus yFS275]EEB07803.1 adaptin [Schizosaccharomyces japonicus yFS275]